jgi:beta-lactamase regulating signal transducer with metallopeptidase domain
MAAMVFAAFELLFAAMGNRRHFLTRRRLSLVACASVFVVLAVSPIVSPWLSNFNVVDAVLAQYLKGNIGLINASEMQAMVNMPRTLVDEIARGTSWMSLVVLSVFGLAALLRLAYLGVNVVRIHRSMASGCIVRDTSKLRIVASPTAKVPFSTRSLRRYIIVLPANVCQDPGAMRMYLGHEAQHIRQGDVDAELILSLLSPLFVLNPGYWFIAGRVRNLAELACDRAFLAKDRMTPREYSLRLLSIARTYRTSQVPYPQAFGVSLMGRTLPWISRKSMLKTRIEEIAADIDAPLRERRLVAAGASLCLALFILMAAMSVTSSGDWSHERIMLSTVVNLERINELNTLAQRSW